MYYQKFKKRMQRFCTPVFAKYIHIYNNLYTVFFVLETILGLLNGSMSS